MKLHMNLTSEDGGTTCHHNMPARRPTTYVPRSSMDMGFMGTHQVIAHQEVVDPHLSCSLR